MPIIDRRSAAIVSMIVVVLALSVAIPPFIAATGEDSSKTFTQTEGEDLQLTGTLFADLTDVRDGQSFTEVASIHTTDTDFNAAETLDNVTVEGSGESADVRLSAGIVNSEDFESSVPAGYTQVAALAGMQGSNAAEVDADNTFHDMFSFSPIGPGKTFRVQMAGQDDSGDNIFALFDGSGGRGPQVVQSSSTGTWRTYESGSYVDTGVSYSLDTAYGLVFTNIDTSTGTYDLDIVRLSDDTVVYSDTGLSFGGGASSIEVAKAYSSGSNTGGGIYDYPRVIDDVPDGTYVSSTHSVNGAETGFVNVTLSDADAVVTWDADADGDGTFETEVSQDTRSTTGNYTTDLSATSGQNFRVNVTFNATGSDPVAELHDEGILTTTTEGTDVNVTLVDTETGQTVDTGPINESETRQFTIGMETVTVTNDDVLSGNESLMTYEYPTYYGMDGGVETLVSNAPLIALALGFIIVVMALYAGRGV